MTDGLNVGGPTPFLVGGSHSDSHDGSLYNQVSLAGLNAGVHSGLQNIDNELSGNARDILKSIYDNERGASAAFRDVMRDTAQARLEAMKEICESKERLSEFKAHFNEKLACMEGNIRKENDETRTLIRILREKDKEVELADAKLAIALAGLVPAPVCV